MTAGFNDGRPPNWSIARCRRLLFERRREHAGGAADPAIRRRPGRRAQPRSDGPNRRVRPRSGSLANNAYRAENDQRTKEPRVRLGHHDHAPGMARIGYLYLRGGEWNGRRILSREFIRPPRGRPILPSFVPLLCVLLGSNGRGTFRDIPETPTGPGWGIASCWSARVWIWLPFGWASGRSNRSYPATAERPQGWGSASRALAAWSSRRFVTHRPGSRRTPRIPQPGDQERDLGPGASIIRKAKGSDNWPITWADDDHLYTAYGDGNGFEPGISEKLSLGFARIEAGPTDFAGVNIRSPSGEQRGDGKAGPKASGMLMVDGVLYMWARNAGNARLAWSKDHASTWKWSDWKFTTSFGCPTFLNFGRNYAAAGDAYVYIYSHDNDSRISASRPDGPRARGQGSDD